MSEDMQETLKQDKLMWWTWNRSRNQSYSVGHVLKENKHTESADLIHKPITIAFIGLSAFHRNSWWATNCPSVKSLIAISSWECEINQAFLCTDSSKWYTLVTLWYERKYTENSQVSTNECDEWTWNRSRKQSFSVGPILKEN